MCVARCAANGFSAKRASYFTCRKSILADVFLLPKFALNGFPQFLTHEITNGSQLPKREKVRISWLQKV